MKILVDCRCLNYPFLTGVNAYTIRFLHCLSNLKLNNVSLQITAMGLKTNRMRELMNQFPFLLNLFDNNISLATYLNYQDSPITQANWFNKILEIGLISQNWLSKNLNDVNIEKYDYVFLPQPRLLKLHSDSKLITIFHDIFSILDKQVQFPQCLIFNWHTCQSLVDRSYKIIAGSISTCQDINKTFFKQTNFNNPKILLIYPALPNLQELQSIQKFHLETNQEFRINPILASQQQNGEVNRCLHEQNPVEENTVHKVDFSFQNFKLHNELKRLKDQNQQYILAISGIEPRKNWNNLLFAHKYLQDKYGWNTTLVLAGAPVDQKYYNKLLQIIKKNKIQNVIWQVNVTENEKNQLIKNCKFIVYPSYYEGFGFPILEAFEHKKTVVTSRVSSLPEIGKNSCVFANPFNYVSIANCMHLLNIDDHYKTGLEDNIEKNRSHYRWTEMQKKLETLLY